MAAKKTVLPEPKAPTLSIAQPDAVTAEAEALAATQLAAAQAEEVRAAEASAATEAARKAEAKAEAKRKRDEERAEAKAATPAPETPTPSPTPKPAAAQPSRQAETAPSCVEVIRDYTLGSSRWHYGQPWHARPGDVFSGERAAWLWEHARDCVVAFPPAG